MGYKQRTGQVFASSGALAGKRSPIDRNSFDFQFNLLPHASSYNGAQAFSNKSSGRLVDPDWCISGPRGGVGGYTPSSSAGVHYGSSGEGCFWLITSSKSSARGTILKTRAQDAKTGAKARKFAQMQWNTSYEPYMGVRIKFPATATVMSAPAVSYAIGLSLTSAHDLGTDNDQVKFWFKYATSATILYVAESIGGVDTLTVCSGVTVTAGDRHFLELEFQPDRTVKCYVDGVLVRTTGAMTAATRLYPFISVRNASTTSSVAKANRPRLGIYRVLMSQNDF